MHKVNAVRLPTRSVSRSPAGRPVVAPYHADTTNRRRQAMAVKRAALPGGGPAGMTPDRYVVLPVACSFQFPNYVIPGRRPKTVELYNIATPVVKSAKRRKTKRGACGAPRLCGSAKCRIVGRLRERVFAAGARRLVREL